MHIGVHDAFQNPILDPKRSSDGLIRIYARKDHGAPDRSLEINVIAIGQVAPHRSSRILSSKTLKLLPRDRT